MSSVDNKDPNDFTTGSAHPHYRNIPLDLTTSPLEKYFQDMYLAEINEQELLTDTTTAASSDESLRHYSRAQPIWIPGALDANGSRHNKRKRRVDRTSTTFPSTMNTFATPFKNSYTATTRQPLISVAEQTQSQNQLAQSRKSAFTVGSLVDRPPAPWPASFSLPHDGNNRKARSSHQQDNDSASDSIESGGDIMFDCESDTDDIM
ncbi:hypothetical protein V8B55DRAFT_1473944 [Mucor lusitanicus]|uniref:Uncharacterized protein n=2 Tax=Mucor circinelloides f. lusitanicus TaxID=29924 RepID=A0A168PF38_MUCCL|nr:hypothetical protein FB192DRAFT_1374647 [Mucor lusitanicus]OAD07644.1 hypothetical protein MUCCIDRAFT_77403 [Mucor lusitanicus CBS 277.49]